tara:strand:- start:812 stop:1039 length:228 start_codon:yes stop_codon:yes gene_type:complete
MSDDEIRNILKSTKDEIFRLERNIYRNNNVSDGERLRAVQIEYCYVRRESEIRRDRHAAHRQYMKDKFPRNNRAF